MPEHSDEAEDRVLELAETTALDHGVSIDENLVKTIVIMVRGPLSVDPARRCQPAASMVRKPELTGAG